MGIALRDAQAQWGVMRKRIPGKEVEKISTRFINRLDIPARLEKVSLKDYCKIGVALPQALTTQATENFLVQYSALDQKKEFLQNISLALATPPPVIDHVSVVLDLDVVTATKIPAKDQDLWPILERLRIVKNELFEACITEKARELFR